MFVPGNKEEEEMVKPLAICIEDLDAVSEASKYLRCVALPGLQPGLGLDEMGNVLWQAGDVLSCELWVSADDRLILYRQEGMAPVVLRRAERSLEVPHGKPVVVLDKDRIDAGPRHLRVHIHGAAASVAAPSPLPPRSPLAGRLAQTVATAALLGAVASTGGCTEVEVRETSPQIVTQIVERPIEVGTEVPQTVRAVTVTPGNSQDTNILRTRGLAGDYVSVTKVAEARLSLGQDWLFSFLRTEASGAEQGNEGLIVLEGNSLWFNNKGPASQALLPVLWGERRYLVEAGALGRFCAPDSGEPRTTRQGYFYLRDGGWSLPAEGAPALLDGTPACSAK
jgi:hypothetical protein